MKVFNNIDVYVGFVFVSGFVGLLVLIATYPQHAGYWFVGVFPWSALCFGIVGVAKRHREAYTDETVRLFIRDKLDSQIGMHVLNKWREYNEE